MSLPELMVIAMEAPYAQHGQLRVTVIEKDLRGLVVAYELSGNPATHDEAVAYLAGMDV